MSSARDGTPCWAALTCPDAGRSRTFYGELLGWTFAGYDARVLCLAGGAPVATITAGSSRWTPYLATSSAAATAARVEAGGGRVLTGPVDLPGVGTLLEAVDPLGVAFGAADLTAPAASRGGAGALCRAEVYTRDGPATDGFYRGLFGYDQVQQGDGANFDYTAWRVGADDVCGRMTVTGELAVVGPPHWIVYFGVSDVDRAAATVPALGGTVLRPATDSPYGRWAKVVDPAGAEFALITGDPTGKS
jgi:predicted enzyme related to lactoylglutathione lyase